MQAPSPTTPPLSAVAERLAPRGLDLVGVVPSPLYDSAQPRGRRARDLMPGCGSVLLVGGGGSNFWRWARQHHGDDGEPTRTAARKLSSELVTWLQCCGVRSRSVMAPSRALSFLALAECAGLGYLSPVTGWLLHPVYGPWVQFRFALLVEGSPWPTTAAGGGVDAFAPCASCDRPCLWACALPDTVEHGVREETECAHHRLSGGCGSSCGMRAACPVGADHRFDDDDELHLQSARLAEMRRAHGAGLWRFVPSRWRCS